MDTIIIGQGYNLKADSSVAKELIGLFDSRRYTSFTCLVAFASYGGVSALTPKIFEAKEGGVEIKVVLGIDQKGTSKEALEEVLKWGVDVKIYHTSDANIFHPKIYLFENEDIFSLIVGSNNLTIPGLVQNVECSLMIKDIKSNPVLTKFYDYWRGILDGSDVALYSLTQSLIDDLYKDGFIPLETTRRIHHENQNEKFNVEGKITFKSKGVQSLPTGFKPRRVPRKIRVSAKPTIVDKGPKSDYLEIDPQILLAEIGGGPRWKQVNFPIKIFHEFFGATKGDNNYKIKLMNVSETGELGEVETRPAVTVKSNNFRFELKCKETSGEYPENGERPIGIFVKLSSTEFVYQILMPTHPTYKAIRDYLEMEAEIKRQGELRRIIVDVEAIHALYPTFIF